MDNVRGDLLRPPHGTTPAAVIANKIYVHVSICCLDFCQF